MACAGSASNLRLEFLQVHGAPLEEPPTVDVVYEADLEVPFVSQECRSFNWLATGPMCWPTRIETRLKAKAGPPGVFVFDVPVSMPGTVRHSLKSLEFVWAFDQQSIALVHGEDGSRVGFWNESFDVISPEEPDDIADARVFQGRIAGDRFSFGGERRFGIIQTGETWAIDRHALWTRNAGTLSEMKRSTTRQALAWYERGERPFGDTAPPHLRRGRGTGCAKGTELTVWLDDETLLWAEDFAAGAAEVRRDFFFHRGQLLSLDELTSEATGQDYRGATLSTGYTFFGDGLPLLPLRPIEQTRLVDAQQTVWRAAGVPGDRPVSGPAPTADWLTTVAACVVRIREVAATATPLVTPPATTTP